MKPKQHAKNEAERDGKPALSMGELENFLRIEFPQVFNSASGVSIERVWHGGALVRQAYREDSVRPGGTISGPTMMALADFAMYVAVLASIGPVPLAVTTNLNINFLRKPGAVDLLAEAKLMKLGKRLAVGEVAIRSDGGADLVAHVTSTFSIPRPQHGRWQYVTIIINHWNHCNINDVLTLTRAGPSARHAPPNTNGKKSRQSQPWKTPIWKPQ